MNCIKTPSLFLACFWRVVPDRRSSCGLSPTFIGDFLRFRGAWLYSAIGAVAKYFRCVCVPDFCAKYFGYVFLCTDCET